METKQSIRKRIFEEREKASEQYLAEASHIICEKVIQLPAFAHATCIYTYVDCKQEVYTKELMEAAWKAGKLVAAPKVEGADLTFYQINSYEQLKPGYFGVPEPENCSKLCEEHALVIVPGVAFDHNRNRVGYGKGFYDRYLSQHPNHPTVAIAFDFQIVEEAPCDPLDILPDVLITQSQTY